MRLGEFGVWATYRALGRENAGQAATLVEDLGFGTFWLGGSPHAPDLNPLLEPTERLVAATAIANVWQYQPQQLAADYTELGSAFPDRVLIGIGIGHPGGDERLLAPAVDDARVSRRPRRHRPAGAA